MMKKLAFILSFLLLPCVIYAICPICTVAVGAGIGFAQWLHVDDAITGLWVGALIVSVTMWTVSYLERKNIKFFGRGIIVGIFYYAITLLPLNSTGLMWHDLNKMWGVDKLILGIVIGSVVFFAFAEWYNYLKKKNDGHAYFPFQKVVMPIAPLMVLSFIFYFVN